MSRAAAIQRTLWRVLGVNLAVAGGKLWAALASGNLTVAGATVDSILDASNNVLALIVIAMAARGPDEDHPYGHDKFETMGALAIVGVLSVTCFELTRGAFRRLLAPEPAVALQPAFIAVLLAAAAINTLVVLHERREGRRLGSPLLLADAAHTTGDIAVSALAIASLLGASAGLAWLDPVLALLVVGIIARSGLQILRVTVPVLVDERATDATQLRNAAMGVPGVTAVPQVRSRTTSSGTVFAELTITVDGGMSVAAGHQLADEVERAVAAALDGPVDVTVHVEPR